MEAVDLIEAIIHMLAGTARTNRASDRS